MPRDARTLPAQGMLHLIGRGNHDVRLFRNARDFSTFLSLLLRLQPDDDFYIHHYVLMHTHYHLLAWMQDTRRLATLIKRLHLTYYHAYVKRHRYKGHLWHSRYRSVIIAEEPHFLECGRYIELNPVRAGLCNMPEKYRWSSYHAHAGRKKDALLRPFLYEHAASGLRTHLQDPANYQAFVHAGIAEN